MDRTKVRQIYAGGHRADVRTDGSGLGRFSGRHAFLNVRDGGVSGIT